MEELAKFLKLNLDKSFEDFSFSLDNEFLNLRIQKYILEEILLRFVKQENLVLEINDKEEKKKLRYITDMFVLAVKENNKIKKKSINKHIGDCSIFIGGLSLFNKHRLVDLDFYKFSARKAYLDVFSLDKNELFEALSFNSSEIIDILNLFREKIIWKNQITDKDLYWGLKPNEKELVGRILDNFSLYNQTGDKKYLDVAEELKKNYRKVYK